MTAWPAMLSQPKSKVAALEQSMRQQTTEQLEDFLSKIDMRHFYADGMYCRVCKRKAGVVIVGKVHKKEHFYIVAAGSVAVTMEDEPATIYRAGEVVVSRPGTKRAVLALEDSVCMTVHRTDKTDLDEIEAELIEPDELALFDARNKLKELK